MLIVLFLGFCFVRLLNLRRHHHPRAPSYCLPSASFGCSLEPETTSLRVINDEDGGRVMMVWWWCGGGVVMVWWWCGDDVVMVLWWCGDGVVMVWLWCGDGVVVV